MKVDLNLLTEVANYLVGLVLILSAIGKLITPNFFISQISEFYLKNVKNKIFIPAAAFAVNGLELVLGLSLILGFYSSLASIITILLLIVFTAGTWENRKELDNCGCFGALIHRSPAHSITENIVMINLLLFTLFFSSMDSSFVSWKFLIIIDVALITIFLFVLFVYFPFRYPSIKFSTLNKGKSIKKIKYLSEFTASNKKVLIVASSNSCPFCVKQIPFINALSKFLKETCDGITIFILSEKDTYSTPEWLDKEIEVMYINNFNYLGLTVNGKPAFALAEKNKITNTWYYVAPFLWDLKSIHEWTNHLEKYLNYVFESYSKNYDFSDYEYLFTILFEQAIKLHKEDDKKTSLEIFYNIINKAPSCLNVPDDILAKSYYNLAIIQLENNDTISSADSFNKAAEYFYKIKSTVKLIESYAISYYINPGSNGQYPQKLIEYSLNYFDTDLKSKFDDKLSRLRGAIDEFHSELKLIDPKDHLD